jgi:cytochrome c-type biogenesis protein CcmE
MFFFSPTEVVEGKAPTGHPFRIGGLVMNDSVKRKTDGLTTQFTLTDNAKQVIIEYTGILPDLFREGQGIVAMGQLNPQGVFVASEVLAKHDENYMPPEVAASLKTAHEEGVAEAQKVSAQ